MHISLAGDERGAEGITVAAWSALQRASRPCRLWVIEDGIDPATQARMRAVWERSPNFAGADFPSLRRLPLQFPSWWTHGRWPMSSCARFQMAEILPRDAQRCVYLDYDTLTGTDLAELHDIDMAGQPIAMVPNTGMTAEVAAYVRSMGLDPARYCNAGVMLIDVAAWRANDVARKLIAYGSAMSPQIWFFDQDMLNSFFADRCLILPERWNLRDAAATLPGNILHFAGGAKPWQVDPANALPAHRAWLAERAEIAFQPGDVRRAGGVRPRLVALRARVQRKLIALVRAIAGNPAKRGGF
jgi:lipopolysaccharide biosynthesis glycosyltransferase